MNSLSSLWPFSDPRDTAVFTTEHVLDRGHVITYVSHGEDDGAWQCHCEHMASSGADARLVALEEVVDLDPSLQELAYLPEGWAAQRSSSGSAWRKFPILSEESLAPIQS